MKQYIHNGKVITASSKREAIHKVTAGKSNNESLATRFYGIKKPLEELLKENPDLTIELKRSG